MNKRKIHLFWCLLLLAAWPLWADTGGPNLPEGSASVTPPPVVLSAKVDRATALTSEKITFTITLTTTQAFAALPVPEVGQKISGFRVVDFGVTEPQTGDDGRLSRSRWYGLQADVSGSYVLPAVALVYRDGGIERKIKTSEVFVEMTAPRQKQGEEAKDIRDINAIIHSPPQLGWLWWLLLPVLIAAVLAWYFYRRVHRDVEPVPAAPPHETALQRLQRLKTGSLIDDGRVKEFYFHLSATMRDYVEGRYGFPASDRTLEEIRQQINGVKHLDGEHKQSLLDILSDTELVKFADLDPGREKTMAMVDRSEQFVQETRPRETEESVI